MSTNGYPLFIEQLRTITATTDALNKLGQDGVFDDEHHHLHIELRNDHGKPVGRWLDEHDGTAWEFAMISDQS